MIPLPDDNENPPPFPRDDLATGFDGVRSPAGRYRLIGNPATYPVTISNFPTFIASTQPTVTGPGGEPAVSTTEVLGGPAYWLAEGLVILCDLRIGAVFRWPVLEDPVRVPLAACPIAVR